MITLTSFMHKLCDHAQEETLSKFRVNTLVDNKLDKEFDPVTEGDRNAEKVIRKMINKTYPEHGILGEEFGDENLDAENVWIIDPIDGTRAFISGIPVWGTLVCLAQDGHPKLGIMHQPFTGERFFSDGNQSWYLGPGVKSQTPIKTRDCGSLANAVMMTTSPRIFPPEDQPAYDRVEDAVKLARYGTDCYAYCMIASGQIDLVVEAGLNAYDVAALIPIVTNAGGKMTDWQGKPVDLLNIGNGQILAAGSAKVHAEAMELLNG